MQFNNYMFLKLITVVMCTQFKYLVEVNSADDDFQSQVMQVLPRHWSKSFKAVMYV